MNVAQANTVGYAPAAFMATKTSSDGAIGVGAAAASEPQSENGASPLRARYPMVALSFNQEASHLVMLFRDPTTGDPVAQIPSKVVLKQYEAAQSDRRRDERRELELLVGGEENGGSVGDKSAGGRAADARTSGGAASAAQSSGASFGDGSSFGDGTSLGAALAAASQSSGSSSAGPTAGGFTAAGFGASSSGSVSGGSSGFSGRASLSLVV